MAVRIRRRRAGWRIWNEWSATGDLWFTAQVAAAAFSSNLTGLLSSGEPGRIVGLPARRVVDSGCQPVLFDVTALCYPGDLYGPGDKQSNKRSAIPVLYSCGA